MNYSSQRRFVNLEIQNPVHGSYAPSPVIQGVTVVLGLQLCLLKKGLWEVPCSCGCCVLFTSGMRKMLSVPALVYWTNNEFQVSAVFYPPTPPTQFLLFCHYQIQVYLGDIVGLVLDHCIKVNVE